MAGCDQLDIVIHGVGAHGSTPQAGKDPIVMGSMAVIAYQSIISRAIDTQEAAVLTVGSFQAGNANNVIPDPEVCCGTPGNRGGRQGQFRLAPDIPRQKCEQYHE
jgi:metal-dependent amidase/aminoacylase/carboxypeptidase family protein